ncbi:hypothetical protein EH165_02240 [Nakamurella antarctica]|uniref:Uncharacterized protein n=1 Tax=Nakamurella antarctica TaxID=1902245 RepID=A0A3G8ZIK0_9ACTN|nr:type II secretion system F family protein [Nakamurella antarctica]AZI57153.1 hypothetical protein EH165_02240 [Nakamurella antarctica]
MASLEKDAVRAQALSLRTLGGRLLVATVSATAGIGAGPLVAVATVIVMATVLHLVSASRTRTRAVTARTELIEAVRTLGRELASGASMVAACESAATVTGAAAAPLMRELAAAARLGADVVSFADLGARPDPAQVYVRARLQAAWTLSREHGIALAALVNEVATGLQSQAEMDDKQSSLLAGPRLSGYLLAALPILGIGLGLGMGANPVPILFGEGVGPILLVVGCSLTCGGLLWAARIAR